MRSTRLLALVSLVLAACPPSTQTETLQLSPATLELQSGELRTVTAQVKAGTATSAGAGAVWTSSDLAVVSVSSTGDGTATVQGVSAGTATVTAKLRTLTATLAVTVTARAATLLRIELTPASASLAKGTTLQLAATGILTDGTRQDLTASAAWTSADAATLTVSSAGLVSGLAPGTTRVTATKDGLSGTLDVTVTAATLTAIEVTPASPSLARGTSTQLTATARFSDHTTQDVTAQVTWSSSSAATATVDAAGQVTAHEVGSAVLSAEVDGVRGSTTLTVTAAVLTAIDLTPPSPVIPRGLTAQLTATGRFSDGTTQDLSSQATWLSAATGVATVDTGGLVTAVTVGTAPLTATVGAISGGTTVTVSPAQLVSLAVTPAAATLARGLTRAFTATGLYSDTSTQDLTGGVTWSSSAPGVASISNATGSAGLVTGQAAGTTTISATTGTISGSTTLTVTAATVASLQISPTTPTLPKGLTQSFTAMGILSDATMQDVTTLVTWTTGSAAVATISNAAGSEGRLTAAGVGNTTVVATIGTVSANTTLTVTAARLDRIDVTPVTPSVPRGTTAQFTATGVYSDASTQDLTGTVTWTSSASGIATISNAAGSQGLLTASNLGTSTVTASLGSLSGSQLVTVTGAALTSIDVTPALPSVAMGRTQQFVAVGHYSDSSLQTLTTQVTWTTGTPATATVSNAAGSEGLASTGAVGTTTVVATLGSVSGSTTLSVTAAQLVSIAVTGAPATLPRGRTANLVATGTYTDASTQILTTQVTWTSAPPTTATVSNMAGSEGRVTAVAVGAVTVTATLGSVSGTASLNVTAAVLESLAVSPAAPSIAKGRTQQFSALGTFSDATTQDLTATVTWGSSATSALTISNAAGSQGLASALAVGNGNVTAQSGPVTGSTPFSVTAAVLTSIAIAPLLPSIARGRTQQFTATGTLSDATTLDLTATVTWTSGTPATATISNAAGSIGLATASAIGTSLITATSGAITGTTTLTVTAAALVSLAVTPAAPTLVQGSNQQFVATGTYSDASTQIITTTVTWASSATGVLTVSNGAGSEGLAHAVGTGPSTLSATSGSVSGSTLVTVTNPTLVSIAVTPATPSLARGRTLTFMATGTFSDTSTQDLTSTVTWNSATPTVATINTAGLVSAVDVGTSVISATSGLLSGSTTLTVGPAVLDSIAVSPLTPSIAKGLTQQFVAMGTLSDGTTQNLSATATWASATGAVASVSSTGLATALTVGTSSISATSGSIVGSTTLTVTAAQLVSIAVTPVTPTINAPGTQQMVATGTYTDASTQNLSATAIWASGSPAIATVSATGLVTAVAVGNSLVSATSGAISGSTTVTVVFPVPVVSSLTPGDATGGVRSATPIVVTFSVAMDPTSLIAQTTTGACTGTLQLSNDNFATCLGFTSAAPVMTGTNKIATLQPAAALATLSTYKVRVDATVQSSLLVPMGSTFTQANGFTIATDGPCGASLMISQVYGGSSSAGATYNSDYVELHNPGSTPVNLLGMALQYASAAGTSWAPTPLPNVTVPAGGYFLVRMTAASGVGAVLPADFTASPALNMAQAAGKIALTATTTTLPGVACPLSSTLDLVGFGTTASCTEGGTTTPNLSVALAAFRGGAGCADANVNGTDFTTGVPLPRNSATTPLICACTANETNTVAEMDYCVLQFPTSISVATSASIPTIYARVFEGNLTTPAGPSSLIRAEIGYGLSTVNPAVSAGWVWLPATFNVQVGNDDEYQVSLPTPAANTYGYTGRFTRDGTNWTYCDLDGAGSNTGLNFDFPGQLGVMTITP